MKKLLLVTLLVGAAYATQAQRRGYDHYPQRTVYSDRYERHDRDDDWDDDDRRGRGHGHGHYKHKKYKHRDYRRDDCYREERVVVVRPRYPYPPPPPPFPVPRRPRVSGVIVFGN
ncbi:hypothetical protein [Chitinophaga lutea]|uniref:hypothetical protein n=1 Tax=Chitinophaga lutea TaxID=2488634 RepID=UPI000F510313|nr:hypothetical protein [Chitinophaga lutea]